MVMLQHVKVEVTSEHNVLFLNSIYKQGPAKMNGLFD